MEYWITVIFGKKSVLLHSLADATYTLMKDCVMLCVYTDANHLLEQHFLLYTISSVYRATAVGTKNYSGFGLEHSFER